MNYFMLEFEKGTFNMHAYMKEAETYKLVSRDSEFEGVAKKQPKTMHRPKILNKIACNYPIRPKRNFPKIKNSFG